MPNLAMRQPGSQFSGDGIDLSWPIGGEREVVAVPDEEMTLRIRRRIAEGQIVITDDKPTKSADSGAREYKLLTGDEARKRMAEPAGPVTRVVYHPATPEDERQFNLEVQSAESESETFRKAQEERARVAEERSAAITKAQIEAEKAAAAEEAPAKEPLDERMKRTEAASADWFAQREKAFMERETARQEEAGEADAKPVETPAADKKAPDKTADEPKAEPAKPAEAKPVAPKAATPAKKAAPAAKKTPTPRATTKG